MNGVSKITVTEDISLVTFSNIPNDAKIMAGILNRFAAAQMNVDMISHSASQGAFTNISLSIFAKDLSKALTICKECKADAPQLNPMVNSSNYKIQLYGQEMSEMHGVAAKVIDTIANSGSEIMMITTSEVDISVLIPATNFYDAIHALQQTFQIPEYKFIRSNSDQQ